MDTYAPAVDEFFDKILTAARLAAAAAIHSIYFIKKSLNTE